MIESQQESSQPILIEQTAKKYKAIRASSIILLLLGAGVAVLRADEFGTGEGWPTVVAAGLCIVGLIVFGVGVVMSWWHHE